MKMKTCTILLLSLLSACSTDYVTELNEGTMNNINTENPKSDEINSPKDECISEPFSLNTKVGEVISDPAFGDFGRLLFPVDRSISTDMTLDQVSTSNVYVWYSHISRRKQLRYLTIYVINH